MKLSKLGGMIAGSVKVPFASTDFSSFLLEAQASGAGVLVVNALDGSMTSMKQAVEFGLTQQMMLVLTTTGSQDIIAVGLPVAKGRLLVASFYEDVSPEARSWTDRFMALGTAASATVTCSAPCSRRWWAAAQRQALHPAKGRPWTAAKSRPT